jgi:hypothetical protein
MTKTRTWLLGGAGVLEWFLSDIHRNYVRRLAGVGRDEWVDQRSARR